MFEKKVVFSRILKKQCFGMGMDLRFYVILVFSHMILGVESTQHD
jgi:hypothetical protein